MSEANTSRLLNLLIALLHTERGLSRERILRDIYGFDTEHAAGPGTAQKDADREPVLRMFERDKASLRGMGADIRERVGYARASDDDTTSLYWIDEKGFRLPPQTFTAEESAWLALAALVCDGAVAGSEAQRALRRLEAAGALPETPPSEVQPRLSLDEPHWDVLTEAAHRGSAVEFDYFAASTGEQRRRRLEPWGLGQRYGQWYVAGHDLDRDAVRVFRLSRIRGAVTAGGPDAFPAPEPGALRKALSGLEDLPTRSARLRVAEDRALDLRREWTPVGPGPQGWDLGTFPFRDVSVAAERIVGFGDAVVVEEPEDLITAVVSRFEGALRVLGTEGAPETPAAKPRRRITTGEERLGRLIDLVPYLLAGPLPIEEVADRFGLTVRQVRSELDLLQESGPIDAGGFQSYIEIIEDRGIVSIANADELSRPRRLSPAEAVTLQLGLQALGPLMPEPQRPVLDRLSDKVAAAAIEGLRGLPEIDVLNEPLRNAALIPALADAAREGRTVRLTYLNATKDERTERLINPISIAADGNRWYVNSYCHRAGGRRVFRIDRIVSAEPAEPHPLPDGFDAGDDALFMHAAGDLEVTVRLAPEALWAEASFDAHDGRDLADGSRRVGLRVSDLTWLPSFLAQFGGAIALEGPAEAVEASRAWIERALTPYVAGLKTR
ncbi:helix-turn-helix transcriptional regulator [Sinomonas sp. P10A9]|uniref:Helix-turn-helix transcriptional regulator n=1 Tax=Sinomonas puerhi TaxID=3238584 RepID=A0AB39L8M3_9MICC